MLKDKQNKSNLGVALGFGSQIFGQYLLSSGNSLGFLFTLGGLVLFIWGLKEYAEAKGHSGAWALLGLLSIFGLIILVCFKDKHKDSAS